MFDHLLKLNFRGIPTLFTPSSFFRTYTIGIMSIIAFNIAACNSVSSAQATVTSTPEVVVTALAADLIGTLTNEDGCIRVTTKYKSINTLVFPPDAAYQVSDDHVTITTGLVTKDRKDVTLRFGEKVEIGGGQTFELNEQLKSTIPNHCPGPYWIVGGS